MWAALHSLMSSPRKSPHMYASTTHPAHQCAMAQHADCAPLRTLTLSCVSCANTNKKQRTAQVDWLCSTSYPWPTCTCRKTWCMMQLQSLQWHWQSAVQVQQRHLAPGTSCSLCLKCAHARNRPSSTAEQKPLLLMHGQQQYNAASTL